MNVIKKVIILALSVCMFASCATSTVIDIESMEFDYHTNTLGARSNNQQTRTVENPYRVGIIQYGSNYVLDDSFMGIKRVFDNTTLNISFEYQNANFDVESTQNIAQKMVADNYDLIIPIGTNPTISMFEQAKYSQTPIVFAGVSDPVGAGVLTSLIRPNSYITGTTTSLDEDMQLNLIQTMQPNIKTIGVIYSLFEPNAISELNDLRDEATFRGIEIVSVGVSSVENITEATYSLITMVEAITTLNDSHIAVNLPEILEIADIANVPVYGSDSNQVDVGCIAGQGYDYYQVGQKTAEIAINVLLGKDISTIPVYEYTEPTYYFNDDVLEKYGWNIPEQFLLEDEDIDLAS